ncbi:MAG: HAD-IA family hydrolase [Lachnospira sp.]
MIRGIIFDMDGVMIDSERQSNMGWLWAAEQLGVEMPMWLIDSFKGAPVNLSKQFFDDYFKGKIDYWEARQLRTEHVYKIRETEGIPVKQGLFKLLDYIKKNNFKCAVATSTRKESAEKTLHTIGAWDYLDAVVYGDEVEHGKPEPDIFLKAANDLGLKPEECIVIEDSINGIRAGHAAAMKVIHVPDTIAIDDNTRMLTHAVLDNLAEVCDVADNWNKCSCTEFKPDRQHVIDTFTRYTSNYDVSDDKIRLKIEHTYKVAEAAEKISVSLGLNQEDTDIAWLLGMFHDIGRFEQLRRYDTFYDAVSVDHAAFSADILFKENKIEDYFPGILKNKDIKTNEILKLLELCIRCHNMYRIPTGLTHREEMFCNILRDADKVDIMRVCVQMPLEAVYEVSRYEAYNSGISPEVAEIFLEKRTVPKELKKTAVDSIVGHISFAFELVYRESIQLVRQQGYLEKMLSFNSDNESTRKTFAKLKQVMEEYVKTVCM